MKTKRTLTLVISFLFPLLICAQSELKIVDIGDFATTNGDTIYKCKIGYKTVGKPNSDNSNIILWPTWFDGTSDDICIPYNLTNWFDTTNKYIIIVDALANGISSSPSNTVDFPEITIRDMVNSQYILLSKHLHIDNIYVVLGISMGGIQAFEWMVAYPDFMEKAISIVGTPKPSSFDLLVYQTQADIIKEVGTDKKDIDLAMRRVHDIFYMNFYTPSYFNRTVKPEEIKKWRDYSDLSNAWNWLAQMNAIIKHDIYKSAGTDFASIKNVIKAEVLIIVALQDHTVNPINSFEIAKALDCELLELTGNCGHFAVWCESDKIMEATSIFLK